MHGAHNPARARGLTRRSVLGGLGTLGLPWLAGCTTPLPLVPAPATEAAAAARLRESAEAHGLAAYRQLTDINIAYAGEWRPLIDGIQPEVVDAGFRGSSQERLMPRLGINAQAYRGPKGDKFVAWRRGAGGTDLGEVGVWFNGTRSGNPALLQAAALVAEGYGLFLLGPLWLSDRSLAARMAGTERVDGQLCDVVEVWLVPGLGQTPGDRAALCIARDTQLTRRVRFTLEGAACTKGAVAEVDTFEHERRFGVMWPMRSFERVVHPIALPAHDWRITGIDVNRGYPPSALAGPTFSGAAAAPARPV